MLKFQCYSVSGCGTICHLYNSNVNRNEISKRPFESSQSIQKYARIEAICVSEHTILKAISSGSYNYNGMNKLL